MKELDKLSDIEFAERFCRAHKSCPTCPLFPDISSCEKGIHKFGKWMKEEKKA